MSLRTSTDFIIVHCAATTPDMDIGAAEIRRWHIDQRKWRDIGYHFVIRRSGAIEVGRDMDDIGAHTLGVNDRSVAVCLVGGIEADGSASDNFTAAQRVSLNAVLRMLAKAYPYAVIRGHRDFANKACPSFDVRAWAASRGLPT